jgi:hypothetical protein
MLGEGFFGTLMRKLFLWSGNMISAKDGAQTTLHCVLVEETSLESGAFYSQFGIYQDKEARKGGWPMKLPNLNATPEVATKLWEASDKLVGL